MSDLAALAAYLRSHPAITGKRAIDAACARLGLNADSPGRPGDDAAALPDGDGWTLFAQEGFINAFIDADPWFAGWCGIMVNVADILAMGGRPTAVTNAIWAPDAVSAAPVLDGMRAAAAAYGVSIVGGHTNLSTDRRQLSVSILGRARALITSFDARPGDVLIAAVDHRGAFREPFDNWDAATSAPPARLLGDIAILPDLAEAGLARAGKDISQGGIAGTALMLAECSGVGIDIVPSRIPLPPGVGLDRWLTTFPSFGFLLSVAPKNVSDVVGRFAARGITAAGIGQVVAGSTLRLVDGTEAATIWDYTAAPYLGLAPREAAHA